MNTSYVTGRRGNGRSVRLLRRLKANPKAKILCTTKQEVDRLLGIARMLGIHENVKGRIIKE